MIRLDEHRDLGLQSTISLIFIECYEIIMIIFKIGFNGTSFALFSQMFGRGKTTIGCDRCADTKILHLKADSQNS